MAEIRRFFAYRHLRSEASSHVISFRRGLKRWAQTVLLLSMLALAVYSCAT